MNKCGPGRREVCNYHVVGNRFKHAGSNKEYSINHSMNCNSPNVVYLITCKTCQFQYVGSTETKFRYNHKTQIRHHGNLDSLQQDFIMDYRISRYRSLRESLIRRN